MRAKFHKQILSEISIIHGSVDMPKNFEINRRLLKESIVYSNLISKEDAKLNTFYLPYPRYAVNFPTKVVGMLNAYITEYIFLNHKLNLRNLDVWGNVFLPNEHYNFIKHIDTLDLRNSADYIMLYGVDITDPNSKIIFHYNDNRKKDREFTMPLKSNQFIIFPSTLSHTITKNKSEDLNTVLTISYIDELK